MAQVPVSIVINGRDNSHGAFKNLSKNIKAVEGHANSLRATMAGLVGVTAVAAGALGFIGLVDEYKLLQSQVKLTTDSQEELSFVMSELVQISKDTFSSLESSVKLYTSLDLASKSTGQSISEVLTVTKAFNQTLLLSGANATEAGSGTLQFAQAMGSSVVQGDEFRNLMETNKFLVGLLTKELDKSIKQIRAMSSAGELTSKVISGVIEKNKAAIDAAVKDAPLIASREIKALSVVSQQFFAESEKGAAITTNLAESIHFLSENFSEIANIAIPALQSLFIILSAKGIASITAYTQAKIVDSAANNAQIISTLRSAKTKSIEAAAMSVAAKETLTNAYAHQQATIGSRNSASATRSLVVAHTANTVAIKAETAAQLSLSTASRAATKSSGLLAGAVGFLGGGFGALIAAVGLGALALSSFNSETEKSIKTVKELKRQNIELAGNQDEIKLFQQQKKLGDLRDGLANINSEIKEMQDRIDSPSLQFNSPNLGLVNQGIKEIVAGIEAEKSALVEKKLLLEDGIKLQEKNLIDQKVIRDENARQINENTKNTLETIRSSLKSELEVYESFNAKRKSLASEREKIESEFNDLLDRLSSRREITPDNVRVSDLTKQVSDIKQLGKSDNVSIDDIQRASDKAINIISALKGQAGIGNTYLQQQAKRVSDLVSGLLDKQDKSLEKSQEKSGDALKQLFDDAKKLAEIKIAFDKKSIKKATNSLIETIKKELKKFKPEAIKIPAKVVIEESGKSDAVVEKNPVKLNTGGILSGYGGGDKVPALLESGEAVVRKERTSIFRDALLTINNGSKSQITELMQRISNPVRLNVGGIIGDTGKLNNQSIAPKLSAVTLSLNGMGYQVTANSDVAESLEVALKNEAIRSGYRK